ncbi:MAG: hypothetical protein KDA30_14230 [Phycisphaerales bacterium]|nr:hypothetical protein [Phycisphaerales bacterium]
MNTTRTVAAAALLSAIALFPMGCASTAKSEHHGAITTEQLEPYECGTITRLNTYQGVFLASKPAASDLEQAKKGGVKTVVNMMHADEQAGFDEGAFVRGLGLAYENPAWNGDAELTDAMIERNLDLLRNAERPMLVHCSSANRVGAIWYAYRALDGGLSDADALAEAKVVGLKSPGYEQIVRDYIARHK